MSSFKLVCGIGWNDVDYVVQPKGEKACPFYKTWTNVLNRISTHKNYSDVSICDEWKLFSNFRNWMIDQPWENRDLDKDLRIIGSKVYSPETCSFIPHRINSIMLNLDKVNGNMPKGVSFTKRSGRLGKPYRAQVSDGNSRYIQLGYFDNPEDAHAAWLKGKKTIMLESIDWWKNEDPSSFRVDIAENIGMIAGKLIPNVIAVANPYIEF